MTVHITEEMVSRLDVAGPRYTSYPTAPEWTSAYTQSDYNRALSDFNGSGKTVSVYVHIPFCATMCYYCGCNVVIRKSATNAGDEYLDYIEKELMLVKQRVSIKPTVRQLHWGGGTPNFLTPDQHVRLMTLIRSVFDIDPNGEIAVEVDPRTVTRAHISTLKTLGFNRISMGIQDFSESVQVAINRVQPVPLVRQLFDWIREEGFSSINVDLIYGLPFQTTDNFRRTIDTISDLRPDRIALYSYAHVPWLKSHQRLINTEALPSQPDKLSIFLNARDHLISEGYEAIGMDHFALDADEMAVSYRNGTLYRNFMGYTVKPADEFLGFGVSSIGFISGHYVQNVKDLKQYYDSLDGGQFATERGLILSGDDQIRQWVIQSLMCHFYLDKSEFFAKFGMDFNTYFSETDRRDVIEFGLLTETETELRVTELGRVFVRNIAMGFDRYLKRSHQQFSRTV